jgi:hypothetical protein
MHQQIPIFLRCFQQTHGHLHDPRESERRLRLLRPFLGTDPYSGLLALDRDRIPVSQPLTKIVKSIYWLHTGGDILQQYNPGWWIRHEIDTSKKHFIEYHLATSSADIHWEDRFVAHFNVGRPKNGVGGFISSSLHFYTERKVGTGMSWIAFASPSQTSVNGKSLYESSEAKWGPPTIEPETETRRHYLPP